MRQTHKYDDIIDLPHPVSGKRAGMPLTDRAAQFAPFAALTGYEDVLEETARLTDTPALLTESSRQVINDRLMQLASQKTPWIRVTFFVPDIRKAGGEYVTVTGQVKRVDGDAGHLLLTDGRQIPLSAIYRLEPAGEGHKY
jgi:hypothetical protein